MSEERKLVTVLFADVSESTALAESLDSEDLRVLMGHYYQHAERIIGEHGGTLEKFIGDAVMAIFGLPQAHGDDAERAVAAALALRDTIAQDTLLAPTLHLRMGINTGEVVASSARLPQRDFLVTGDTVNIAARLQQHAHIDEILVGERTFQAARRAFLFQDEQHLRVKGKREAVSAFTLIAARPVRLHDHPPFVGRDQDLRWLLQQKERVLTEQRPYLVSLLAPVGTGKSRLLEEFLQWSNAATEFQIATARCLPYGQPSAYWPLHDLLRNLLHHSPEYSLLVTFFQQNGYKQDDASRLSNLLLKTLAVAEERQPEGVNDRESILTTWRLLIELCASQAPLLLVFEDLHWASDSLLDLVEYIVHLRTRVPLFIIILSRPELLDRRPTWNGEQDGRSLRHLAPLNDEQSRALLHSTIPSITEEVYERILARAGGNPFFLLELVRGFTEGRWQQGQADEIVLPDTIQSALLARLDLLGPLERSVLLIGSVAGQVFQSDLLYALLPEQQPPLIENALASLSTRELIEPTGQKALPTHASIIVYDFCHILIRDVAYSLLSRAERIRLHSQIANWLEKSGMNADVRLIAYHYQEAVLLIRQSSLQQNLPFSLTHAATIFERAGILASQSGSFVEAHGYLQLATELCAEEERASAYEVLGDNLPWGGASQDQAYAQALVYWRQTSNHVPLMGARLLRKYLIHQGRIVSYRRLSFAEAATLRHEALQLAEEAADRDETWRIRVTACFFLPGEGALQEQDTWIQEKRTLALDASNYFEQRQNWEAMSEALDGYMFLSQQIGALQDVLQMSQRRLASPDLPTNEWGDAIAVTARVFFFLGQYDQSIHTVQQALTQLRPGRTLTSLGWALRELAASAFVSGQWDELERMLPVLDEIRDLLPYDPQAKVLLLYSYYPLLHMALARENTPLVQHVDKTLQQIIELVPSPYRTTFAEYRELLYTEVQTPLPEKHFNLQGQPEILSMWLLPLFNEHDQAVPEPELQAFMAQSNSRDFHSRCTQIARALLEKNDTRLQQAIAEAEAHQAIIHAARMRIILARHTRQIEPLQIARATLERVGDRRFLRVLEATELALLDNP